MCDECMDVLIARHPSGGKSSDEFGEASNLLIYPYFTCYITFTFLSLLEK